jgi:glutamate N-acetyltransferase/amino-acid N-acetyltransferase
MSAAPSRNKKPLHLPAGFLWSSATAGIKASGRADLALAEAPMGATAAAVFTKNRVCAAPVQLDRTHLRKSNQRVRAVLVNSGNANCATGKQGIADAQLCCSALGSLLEAAPEFVFPSSTGIIGVPMPVEKLTAALPKLVSGRKGTEKALRDFGHAILTTDTVAKTASESFEIGGRKVSVTGVAKGSGMIHPNLATMLVYIFTDIEAEADVLQESLADAVADSFNCISVDGDTSTNDTVLVLASGASKVPLNSKAVKPFDAALAAVCASLAEQIIRDGEGARHLIRLHVEQARTRDEALHIAREIAHSPLVKTAWAGADPNWGRLLSTVGKSGVPVNPEKVNIFIGEHQVCRNGGASGFDVKAAHKLMLGREYEIRILLGRGKERVQFLTCDLTTEYVHINADYST